MLRAEKPSRRRQAAARVARVPGPPAAPEAAGQGPPERVSGVSLTSVLGSVPGAALKADEPSDGRRQRSERAKQAALDALWELLHEGELMPSAQRVAERAGMSLRTLYHHYEGNEALFRELAWRQFARIQSLVLPLPPAQPVEDRVVALVGQRAALYESITPLRRAAILH